MRLGLLLLALALLSTQARVQAQAPPAPVAQVLQKYCLDCHQGAKAKGDLKLDALTADFAKQGPTWGKVFDRLADRSMPPRGKTQPSEDERKTLTAWLDAGLTQAETTRVAREGRTTLRRLSRTEWANTLRDLLAINLDLSRQLPQEPLVGGFENNADALSLSAAHVERYLEGADLALDAALKLPPKPIPTKKTIPPGTPDELKIAGDRGGLAAITQGQNLVIFRNSIGRELFKYRTDAAGWYRFRIPVVGHNLDDKAYSVEVSTGTTSGAFLFQRHEFVDLERGAEPKVVEFEKHLPRGATVRLQGHGFPQRLQLDDPKSYKGPGWGFGPIEVEGPLLRDWPPESRTRLLGKVEPAKGTPADLEAILAKFLPRAFRRPTTPAEVGVYIKIAKERLSKGDGFELALRAGLRAALCSPDFLFLREKPGPLDDHALASRLSYFLLRSTPDEPLLEAARTGKLRDPRVLRDQATRLLNDPRSQRFIEDFCDQWLSLQEVEFTTPDRKLYPEYDDQLHDAVVAETQLYVTELLRQNRPVSEIVASDWTFLNGRLAEHYGIPGVKGQAMRRVTLPANSPRGGILTQASVLKVTANGTTTSPILRGLWVLDRILGQPAPPPPGNVAAIEPDIRGAINIRDQLAKHRTQESCAGCHRKIDPPGFALEALDAIGGFRERYRASPSPGQKPVAKMNVRVPENNSVVEVPLGPVVDQGDTLGDGRKFANVIEYKKLLLTDHEPLARNLAEKLLTFATGTLPGRGDREAIEAILTESRRGGHGARDILHGVILSPLFMRK